MKAIMNNKVTFDDDMHLVKLDQTSSLSIPFQSEARTNKLIFVWAEGWTNLYTTFVSMGFTSLFIVIDKCSYVIPMLIRTFNIKVISVHECRDIVQSQSQHSVALILEGRLDRIMDWYDSILECKLEKSLDTIVLIFTSRCRKFNCFKNFNWKKVKHSDDTGGATSATFQVAYRSNQIWKEVKSLPNWNLVELIDATISGKTTEVPVNKNIILKLDDWNKAFALPSVFSHIGWVKRKLTLFEILRALDVPKYMDNELKLLCNDNSFLDAIMHAPPGKISLLLTLSLLADSTQDQKSRLTSTSSLYQAVIKGNFNPISIQESSIDESVKADDAAVPTSLWNRKLFLHPRKYIPEKHDRILENLGEKFDLRWYRKHLMQSFSRYMQSKHGIDWAIKLSDAIKQYIHGNTKSEIIVDGNVGADAVGRAVNADWWNCSDGSTLLFWRGPEEVRLEARDGSPFP